MLCEDASVWRLFRDFVVLAPAHDKEICFWPLFARPRRAHHIMFGSKHSLGSENYCVPGPTIPILRSVACVAAVFVYVKYRASFKMNWGSGQCGAGAGCVLIPAAIPFSLISKARRGAS